MDNVRPLRPGPEELMDDRYLLDTFMEHTPDRVFFKDEKSRFIRGVSTPGAPASSP